MAGECVQRWNHALHSLLCCLPVWPGGRETGAGWGEYAVMAAVDTARLG